MAKTPINIDGRIQLYDRFETASLSFFFLLAFALHFLLFAVFLLAAWLGLAWLALVPLGLAWLSLAWLG